MWEEDNDQEHKNDEISTKRNSGGGGGGGEPIEKIHDGCSTTLPVFMNTLLILLCVSSAIGGDVHVRNVVADDYNDSRLRVLIVCGVHGRELVTTHVCKSIQTPVEHVNMRIVDVLNEAGTRIARERDTCWRGNGNGVDLNRNWTPIFRSDIPLSHSSYPGAEEYPGTHPMSENETQFLAGIMHSFKPHVLVAVHSGDVSCLLPYDGTMSLPPMYSHHVTLAREAMKARCPACRVGSGASTLYISHGTMSDYAREIVNVPYVYTLEVFKNDSAAAVAAAEDGDCHAIFNPYDRVHGYEFVGTHWAHIICEDLLPRIYNDLFEPESAAAAFESSYFKSGSDFVMKRILDDLSEQRTSDD